MSVRSDWAWELYQEGSSCLPSACLPSSVTKASNLMAEVHQAAATLGSLQVVSKEKAFNQPRDFERSANETKNGAGRIRGRTLTRFKSCLQGYRSKRLMSPRALWPSTTKTKQKVHRVKRCVTRPPMAHEVFVRGWTYLQRSRPESSKLLEMDGQHWQALCRTGCKKVSTQTSSRALWILIKVSMPQNAFRPHLITCPIKCGKLPSTNLKFFLSRRGNLTHLKFCKSFEIVIVLDFWCFLRVLYLNCLS